MRKKLIERIELLLSQLERCNNFERFHILDEERKAINTMVAQMWFSDIISERTYDWFMRELSGKANHIFADTYCKNFTTWK